jgi:YgiT-type zinc finger domain-containing protein
VNNFILYNTKEKTECKHSSTGIQVPADICKNCGEYYLSGEVTGQVLSKAEEAVQKGVKVEILRFAA